MVESAHQRPAILLVDLTYDDQMAIYLGLTISVLEVKGLSANANATVYLEITCGSQKWESQPETIPADGNPHWPLGHTELYTLCLIRDSYIIYVLIHLIRTFSITLYIDYFYLIVIT